MSPSRTPLVAALVLSLAAAPACSRFGGHDSAPAPSKGGSGATVEFATASAPPPPPPASASPLVAQGVLAATSPTPADSEEGRRAKLDDGVRAEAKPKVEANAYARRIIKNATLDVVAKSPTSARGTLTDIVVSKGGYVIASDVAESGEAGSVRIVARVPSERFEETLDAIRRSGSEVARENTSGQDVSEEYADLEARVRAQRAVESQYLEIMKRANTIPETLAVQQKLGEIRTEIERAEGRRRYLENQSSMSTITLNVSRVAPMPVVESEPGFARSVKEAAHDSLAISVNLVNGGIRMTGALAPFVVFFGIPIFFTVRFVRQRRKRAVFASA